MHSVSGFPFSTYGTSHFIRAMQLALSVFDNSFIFVLLPLFLLFQLLAWNGFKSFFMAAVYSLIGFGEILLLLTPVLENKINTQFRQNLHLLLAFLAAVAVLSYGFISDLRFGVESLRIGYYYLALSFLLILLSSILQFVVMRMEKSFKL